MRSSAFVILRFSAICRADDNFTTVRNSLPKQEADTLSATRRLRAEYSTVAASLRLSRMRSGRRIRRLPLYADYRCHYQGLKINWRIAQQKLSEADRKALHEIARDGIVDPQEYASLSDELRAFVDAESVVYLDGLKPFGERVEEQLWTAIQAEYNLPETPPSQTLAETDPLAEEADYHKRFMESRLRVYVGRDKMQRALTKFADGEHTIPCLVTGPSGSGKSAALAKFVTTYEESHPDVAGDSALRRCQSPLHRSATGSATVLSDSARKSSALKTRCRRS